MIVSCNSEEGVARASTNDARMREVCCVVHGDEPNDADELLNGAELLNGDELINGDELLDSGDLLVYLDFTDNENILEMTICSARNTLLLVASFYSVVLVGIAHLMLRLDNVKWRCGCTSSMTRRVHLLRKHSSSWYCMGIAVRREREREGARARTRFRWPCCCWAGLLEPMSVSQERVVCPCQQGAHGFG